METRDNYALQAAQGKKRFLTYDPAEIIERTGVLWDEAFFYTRFLGQTYRISRSTGDIQREGKKGWEDGNSFAEVMTLLDWLCDSSPQRKPSGRWTNIVTQGHFFHRSLQEDSRDPEAQRFQSDQQGFSAACQTLGGIPGPGGDLAYSVEVLDGLRVLLQLWLGDEEFPPRFRILWDENVCQYLRYETTWYCADLIRSRLLENMP